MLGILIWQGMTAKGAPDPTQPHTSKTVALLDIAVLVFREGLECILVLSAITASMVGDQRIHRRPVAAGAGVGFIATLITWIIAVGIVGNLAQSVSALDLQAATGSAGRHCPAGGDELVFPQGLLGWLDRSAQQEEERSAQQSG